MTLQAEKPVLADQREEAPTAAATPRPSGGPTSQDIKAIMQGLGCFHEMPWRNYKHIATLPGESPELLKRAMHEIREMPAITRPDLESARQEAADCLQSLSWTLQHNSADPDQGYLLNRGQVLLYQTAWRSLETLRKELAETLGEVLEPFIGVISDPNLQSSDLKSHKNGRDTRENPAANEAQIC